MSAAERVAVRAGDVFRYDETRWATVMEVLPGGRAVVRYSGSKNGKRYLAVGDEQVRAVKTWERVGRCECLDGHYLQLNHAALANAQGGQS